MLTIQENPNYSIGILDDNSFVTLVMVAVNIDDGRLIFKTEFKGILSDFTNKYGDYFTPGMNVEIYLDLYVYLNNTQYHFATISSDNDLTQQFEKTTQERYPYEYYLDSSLTLNLIEESTMKGIISNVWESYSLTSEDLQAQIDKLNALVLLNTQKLKTYKTTAAELAIRGAGMGETENMIIDKNLPFGDLINSFYKVIKTYDDLGDNITLSATDIKKYNAAKSIYRNMVSYYKLVTGKNFPVKG